MVPQVVLFALCALLSIPASYAATDKVLCYYASWAIYRPGNGKFTPEDIQAKYCTHIFYSFLGLNGDGTLKFDPDLDVKQNGFKRVSDLKKVNPKLKTLFSVGGAAAGSYSFSLVASNATLRAVLVQNTLDLIKKYNFDGIDIDWEYPWMDQNKNYIALLSDLSAALRPKGYLVTVAVAPNPSEVWGGYDIPTMSKVLDIINVMTYDFYGDIGYTVQTSPLYASSLESPWQRDFRNANSSIAAWIAGGADPQKVAIGAAFYGHTFYLADPNNGTLHAPTKGRYAAGPFTSNTGTLGYNELCEFHKKGIRTWDDEQKVSYLHDGEMWAGGDDEKSVAEKVKYAKQHNLAGIFIWSIDTDDKLAFCGKSYALMKSIDAAMK